MRRSSDGGLILFGTLIMLAGIILSIYMGYKIVDEDWGQYFKLVGAGILTTIIVNMGARIALAGSDR